IFIVSTGRLFSAIYPKTVELGLDKEVIVYQGGGIYNIKTKEQIFGQYFKKEDAVKALEYIESMGSEYVPLVYINDICHAKEKNDYVDEFAKICNVSYKTTGIPLSQYVANSKDKPVKALVLMQGELCDSFVAKGNEDFPNLAFMRSHNFVVEIITKGINKGLAVRWLCEKYGISTDEAIAMGDSENDIAMIETAGLGVAMGNAMPKGKQAADYIADTNDNDGVAKVIYKFCLNGEENE
ncbi:MAG: HAD-IIB family hydrolase, partial [Clostridia bacterium]|nr:HAD-IIB family hydrolase [Clostridia bacterium]